MPLSLGQGSGDFRETSGRVQPFYKGTCNTFNILAPDAFTQANPPVVTTNVSATLAAITAKGVLGGTVAFTRHDAGNGYVGGPKTGTSDDTLIRPLGIFVNDAVGNPFENTPGPASGRGTYYCGMGTYGVSVYETKNIETGAALTWSVGQRIYASRNGLLTNLNDDGNSYESFEASADNTGIVLGIVRVAPDANNSMLVFDLRI